jgi:glycine/D-amino acid oxidase-like deaminating enzyme/nitrite reductase/ring-hydroxylating ferredoxin subunit
MEPEGGRTLSIWASTADVPGRPSLAEDTTADVCIVGAGIAGLTTAYLLTREGRTVVVLDDGPIGGGETGRTTAHLTSALDDRFYHLERLHGERGARLAAESHSAAIDRIESIVSTEKIECGFERLDGYLFAPPGESGGEELERELEAARRAGLEVQRVPRAPLGSFDTGPALRFSGQGQFHPLKYLAGLTAAILHGGGRIFTGVHVEEFEGGRHAHVKTATGRKVAAAAIVVATNTPVNDKLVIHTKQAAYRTYVVGLDVPIGSVSRALFWDTLDPYHYVRQETPGGGAPDVLIVGGEDHRTGQAEDAEERWTRLERWTRERFPMAQGVRYRWSGQILEPGDSLAFIGRNPMDKDNVFIATGDSGNGMTHGTIAGILLTDLIQGRENAWADLYEPSRKTLRAAIDYASELAKSTRPYGHWVTPGEVTSASEIAPGEGGVLREGLHRIAVYREQGGGLVKVSAVCTHLGCIVEWNAGEKTWDCPCHGSRYAPDGHVLNGPARTDLSRLR